LHTCWCIVFGVFEFKSMFEFNCLSVFQIENPSPLALLFPYPFLARSLFEPSVPKTVGTPSTLGPARRVLAQHGRRPSAGPPRPSAAARWGPLVIPHLASCSGRTRGPNPSLRRARLCAWPRAHLPGRPGPIKAAATPGCTAFASTLATELLPPLPNPSRAATVAPPRPPPPSRRGHPLELRVEVRITPVSSVHVLVPRFAPRALAVARVGRHPPCRAARRHRRPRAHPSTLDRFLASRASLRRKSRRKLCLLVVDRAGSPEFLARRRSSAGFLSPVRRSRPPPSDLDRAVQIASDPGSNRSTRLTAPTGDPSHRILIQRIRSAPPP
jgi:hypothetical protein